MCYAESQNDSRYILKELVICLVWRIRYVIFLHDKIKKWRNGCKDHKENKL